jgi:hypothetical protein
MVVPSGPRITVRNFPPGRRSISHSVVIHGRGQNHPRQAADVPGVRGRELAGPDDRLDPSDAEGRHGLGRVRTGEVPRRHLIHAHVRALGGEQHGDQQGVRIPVVSGIGESG